MSRIPTPATIDAAPAAAQPMPRRSRSSSAPCPTCSACRRTARRRSKAISACGALGKGALAPTDARADRAGSRRDQRLRLLPSATRIWARTSRSSTTPRSPPTAAAVDDPKADAAVRFAAKVSRERGHVGEPTSWQSRRRAMTTRR